MGRSQNPYQRLKDHQLRLGIAMTLECIYWYRDLSEACEAEKHAIRNEKSPFNKRVSSSPGRLGMPNTMAMREAVSRSMKSRLADPAKRAEISTFFRNLPRTAEHCEKISAALKGQTFSAERCASISKALKGKRKGVPQTAEHKAARFASAARTRILKANQ